MKKLFTILLSLSLFSCLKKDAPAPPPVYQFTATVNLTPKSTTLDYQLYVTNDPKNRNDSFMIYAGTIKAADMKTHPFKFGFDFQKYVCKDFTVTPGKPLYAATREHIYGNTYEKLNYDSTTIK